MINMNLELNKCELANMTDDELQCSIETRDMDELTQDIMDIQHGATLYSIRVINQLMALDYELISKINILNGLNRIFKDTVRFEIAEFEFHLRRLCNIYRIDDDFIDETKYSLYAFPVSHTAYKMLLSYCVDDNALPDMINRLNKEHLFRKFKIIGRIQSDHYNALESFRVK